MAKPISLDELCYYVQQIECPDIDIVRGVARTLLEFAEPHFDADKSTIYQSIKAKARAPRPEYLDHDDACDCFECEDHAFDFHKRYD